MQKGRDLGGNFDVTDFPKRKGFWVSMPLSQAAGITPPPLPANSHLMPANSYLTLDAALAAPIHPPAAAPLAATPPFNILSCLDTLLSYPSLLFPSYLNPTAAFSRTTTSTTWALRLSWSHMSCLSSAALVHCCTRRACAGRRLWSWPRRTGCSRTRWRRWRRVGRQRWRKSCSSEWGGQGGCRMD